MSNRRVMREDMPEAGKPEGLCAECGKHGNQGWVDLSVWRRHVVPCIECENRADGIAYRRAKEMAEGMKADLEREGFAVTALAYHFDAVDGHPQARTARASAEFVPKTVGMPVGVP